MSYRRVTIVEIAKEAGVSAQTVSRVVNGHTNVAEETRQRVQAIIEQRGYHPSRLARSLLRGRSNTIGVVSYGLGLYGPSQTLAGIVRDAHNQGYTVVPIVLNDPATKKPEQILGQLIEFHVDGIIWAVPEIGNNHQWVPQTIAKVEIPFVFITMGDCQDLTIVKIDNRAGGQMAAEHLVERGRRTLGVITGDLAWWEARERLQGWLDVVQRHGLPHGEDLIRLGDWSAASGEARMRDLLQQHPEVDGVFVCNDSMAVAALKAAREMGRRVPVDLGIVGFDDIPESAYFHPTLTTIHQDLHFLGSCAVKALNTLIQAKEQETRFESILIKPKLVVRAST
jgi:DNA-binding LacI/PurR family transcriptional regulator